MTVIVPLPSEDAVFVADAARWDKHSCLELSALATAVPCARKHARLVLGEWGLAELADTVELVVSELVTNALHASTGLTGSRYLGQWVPGVPPIRIWLCSDDQRVLIQVWDSSDQNPVARQPSPESENGRGLWLVEMLSEDHGTYMLEHASGKVVWASVTP